MAEREQMIRAAIQTRGSQDLVNLLNSGSEGSDDASCEDETEEVRIDLTASGNHGFN